MSHGANVLCSCRGNILLWCWKRKTRGIQKGWEKNIYIQVTETRYKWTWLNSSYLIESWESSRVAAIRPLRRYHTWLCHVGLVSSSDTPLTCIYGGGRLHYVWSTTYIYTYIEMFVCVCVCVCANEGRPKNPYADPDIIVKSDKKRCIFQQSPFSGPHISSIGVTVLESSWSKKSSNRRYDVIVWIFQSRLKFEVGLPTMTRFRIHWLYPQKKSRALFPEKHMSWVWH